MPLNINSISNLFSAHSINKAVENTNKSLKKLSSGLSINQAKDNPSDLLISEILRSQVSGYEASIRNTQETNNVLSIAEGGLGSVSGLLNKMQGLTVQAGNSGIESNAQISAQQAEMNSALSSISRIINTTSFAGKNLLNGNTNFNYQIQDNSNIISSGEINNIAGSSNNNITINYSGGDNNQAEKAYIQANIGQSQLSSAQKFVITGNNGSREFIFSAGTTINEMAKAINNSSQSTGVQAYTFNDQGSGATSIRLVTSDYGSGQSLKLDQQQGNIFTQQGNSLQVQGKDATVNINGESYRTNGLSLNIDNPNLSAKIDFNAGTTLQPTIAQTGYENAQLTNAQSPQKASINNITGGLQLQLGAGSGSQNREKISLGNFNIYQLGKITVDNQQYSLGDLFSGGSAELKKRPDIASQVISQAIQDVAGGRARIGAYQADTLQTNVNALSVTLENIVASESYIRDTDMAKNVTDLIKNKLLTEVGIKAIQAKNMNNNNVFKLLNM